MPDKYAIKSKHLVDSGHKIELTLPDWIREVNPNSIICVKDLADSLGTCQATIHKKHNNGELPIPQPLKIKHKNTFNGGRYGSHRSKVGWLAKDLIEFFDNQNKQ